MAPKYQILTVMLLLGVAFASGYYLSPAKVVTKDKVTVIREKPDGSKETIIEERERIVKIPVSAKQKDWIASALVPVDGFQIEKSQMIISVQKRFLGQIYAGPWVSLDGSFGLGVSLRF